MRVRVSEGKVREVVELREESENERMRYFRVRVMIYIGSFFFFFFGGNFTYS